MNKEQCDSIFKGLTKSDINQIFKNIDDILTGYSPKTRRDLQNLYKTNKELAKETLSQLLITQERFFGIKES